MPTGEVTYLTHWSNSGWMPFLVPSTVQTGNSWTGWKPIVLTIETRRVLPIDQNTLKPKTESKTKTMIIITTRSSADADNRLDAFSGQSRSTNIVPFHVTYSFLLCNSNLSLRRAVFKIFDFKKCRDLEMGVKGHSRSLRVVSFDRLCMVSY